MARYKKYIPIEEEEIIEKRKSIGECRDVKKLPKNTRIKMDTVSDNIKMEYAFQDFVDKVYLDLHNNMRMDIDSITDFLINSMLKHFSKIKTARYCGISIRTIRNRVNGIRSKSLQ